MSIQDVAAKLKGYRTIAFNDAVVTLVVAANVALRFDTNTKVGSRF